MLNVKVEARPENKSKDAPVRTLLSKSRFDDAEYKRWSEKLLRGSSKGK